LLNYEKNRKIATIRKGDDFTNYMFHYIDIIFKNQNKIYKNLLLQSEKKKITTMKEFRLSLVVYRHHVSSIIPQPILDSH